MRAQSGVRPARSARTEKRERRFELKLSLASANVGRSPRRRAKHDGKREKRISQKVGLKLRARVLTYGPGKGACILRLTLQSVPLETKTQSRTKGANEQIRTSPPPHPLTHPPALRVCPSGKKKRKTRETEESATHPASRTSHARTHTYV